MGDWDYKYNALGELSYQDDAKNQRTCLYYDSLGRVTKKYYTATGTACPSNPASPQVSYTYDAVDRTNAIGRRTGMTDPSGSTSWYYDARGRVTREDKVVTGVGSFRTTWTYNSADLVNTMRYPSDANWGQGETVTYAYTPQMALSTLSGESTYVSRTVYDAQGRLQLRSLGGALGGDGVISVDYQYFGWDHATGLGRLWRILSQLPEEDPIVTRQDLRYAYDYVGNVLTIKDFVAGSPQKQTFTYDSLDRLISAKAESGTGGTYSLQSYAYSSTTGNMTSNAGTAYAYNDPAHKHAVTHLGGVQKFWHDANGNMTTRITTQGTYYLTYDQENRLTGVSGAATATFVYDGDGNRVKGTVNGVTTTYIGSHFEWSGSTAKKYYYAGATRVAMREGDTLYYLLGDHLGSTAVTADASGNKVSETRSMPFGADRYVDGASHTSYRYTGQRSESGIGLYYYGARWYDSSLGRFIQADTIVPLATQGVQALDRYAYVNNNPLRYNDPSGHASSAPGAKVGVSKVSGVLTTSPATATPTVNPAAFSTATAYAESIGPAGAIQTAMAPTPTPSPMGIPACTQPPPPTMTPTPYSDAQAFQAVDTGVTIYSIADDAINFVLNGSVGVFGSTSVASSFFMGLYGQGAEDINSGLDPLEILLRGTASGVEDIFVGIASTGVGITVGAACAGAGSSIGGPVGATIGGIGGFGIGAGATYVILTNTKEQFNENWLFPRIHSFFEGN